MADAVSRVLEQEAKRRRLAPERLPWEPQRSGVLAWTPFGPWAMREPPLPRVVPSEVADCTLLDQFLPTDALVTAGGPVGARGVMELDEESELAVQQWLLILIFCKDACPLSERLWTLEVVEGRDSALELLKDCLAGKAASTLRARAGSVLQFMRWARTVDQEPFPINSDVVHTYLVHLRTSNAPASRASRFREALNFCKGCFDMPGAAEAASNPMNVGAAIRCGELRKPARQKSPLTVAELRAIENAAAHHSSPDMQSFAGYVCFLVYSRMRHADAQRVQTEPQLDQDAARSLGYVECLAGTTKTGRRAAAAGRHMPIVAPMFGITDHSWAHCWLACR